LYEERVLALTVPLPSCVAVPTVDGPPGLMSKFDTTPSPGTRPSSNSSPDDGDACPIGRPWRVAITRTW
jgi:hypothetical protein